MPKFLIIQTAFIGDVVLATAVLEKIHVYFPEAEISILVRKGNESLFNGHPYLKAVLIWNKKERKLRNLFSLLKQIRNDRYDKVINLQRYFSTGMLTAFSGAGETIGFDKNPLSFLFNRKVPHHFDIKHPRHEVERNNDLIKHFTDQKFLRPALYPSLSDYQKIASFNGVSYITMTPSSVWFTKQYPVTKWIELLDAVPENIVVYLLGGPDNVTECEQIKNTALRKNIEVLAGKLTFLQSAALMEKAVMNYVNDSAPLHFASARNAPVTAIFCSTIPAFGYTPLSNESYIVQTREVLSCKPCGLHGHRACPLGHFRCALTIETQQLLNTINVN